MIAGMWLLQDNLSLGLSVSNSWEVWFPNKMHTPLNLLHCGYYRSLMCGKGWCASLSWKEDVIAWFRVLCGYKRNGNCFDMVWHFITLIKQTILPPSFYFYFRSPVSLLLFLCQQPWALRRVTCSEPSTLSAVHSKLPCLFPFFQWEVCISEEWRTPPRLLQCSSSSLCGLAVTQSAERWNICKALNTNTSIGHLLQQ